METKVRKVGNALGIILPKGLVTLDEKFDIEQLADKIVLIPKKDKDFYAMAKPLEFHREEELSDIEGNGREVW